MVRADQPTYTKRGEVCIYYKKCLPSRILNIVFSNECIKFALRNVEKTVSFVFIYRSRIQSQEAFKNFYENFGRTLDNLVEKFTVAIVHVNSNLMNW